MCDDSIEHRQVFRTAITIIIFLFVIVVGGGFSFLVDVCAIISGRQLFDPLVALCKSLTILSHSF